MSPFSCGWITGERHISSADLSPVARAIDSGFTPVLHGDAVLDEIQTDVYGVYDRPPTEHDAILLKEIVELTVVAHDTTGGMKTKISASNRPKFIVTMGEAQQKCSVPAKSVVAGHRHSAGF